MPVQRVKKGDKYGYRWGESGKIFYYILGDKQSRERARKKAEKQAQAIYASGWREK